MSNSHSIGRAECGRTVGAVVKRWLQISWSQAKARIGAGEILVNSQVCTDEARRLRVGDRVFEKPVRRQRSSRRHGSSTAAGRTDSKVESSIAVVFSDRDVIVVDKPAGITTMRHAAEAAEFGGRGKRFLPTTLEDRLRQMFSGPIRAVHRIDRDTSGLLVFARTEEAAKQLGRQFREHSVQRSYLALVRGTPVVGRIESWLVADRGDGRRGSSTDQSGKRAVTHVRLIEHFDHCALVECRLESGRTHQIRIHLGEAGTPLAGETIYDRPIHGSPAPDLCGSPRLALHAAVLGFEHPRSKTPMVWKSELPPDLLSVIQRLRKKRRSAGTREP